MRARLPVLLAVLVLAGACDEEGPTTPGGPAPEITKVDPSEVAPSASPQILSISGQGFATGLTVLLTPPNGARTEITGDAIQGLQSVAFQVSAVLDTPGEYRLGVRLVNGSESNEVTVNAVTATGTVPHIDVVTPGGVQVSPSPTIITLTGTNFAAGSTVNLTRPAGTTAPLPSTAIVSASATSLQLSIVFATGGTYSLSVTNPEGQTSNTVTLTAF